MTPSQGGRSSMLLTLDLKVQSVSFSHGPKPRPRFEHHANRRSGKVDGTHGGCHSATGTNSLGILECGSAASTEERWPYEVSLTSCSSYYFLGFVSRVDAMVEADGTSSIVVARDFA